MGGVIPISRATARHSEGPATTSAVVAASPSAAPRQITVAARGAFRRVPRARVQEW